MLETVKLCGNNFGPLSENTKNDIYLPIRIRIWCQAGAKER